MNNFADDLWGFPSSASPGWETVDIAVRAKRPGRVPPDGETQVGGVHLPAGSSIRPEQYEYTSCDGSKGVSALLPHIGWYSDTDWDSTLVSWVGLARAFSQTGLWPVVGGPGNRCAEPRIIKRSWPRSRTHNDEAANVLQDCWDGRAVVARETGEPLPENRPPFPGVPVGKILTNNVEKVPLAGWSNWNPGCASPQAGLLLVPAMRPADVPQLVGWAGPGNYSLGGHEISAVLRSWEERFGAVLYQLGPTTLALRVARPPTTLADATVLMEEHYLLCVDNFGSQSWEPPISRDDYAKRLINAPVWDFWWD
ncbi:hypothetical protein ABIB48_003474 [Arthrobacter sp. UYCu511]|uniref:DUF4253 domain-containing protein n=1 Tax=Arthrobacter sp. UYCu511 TaxID=3156337 RepID=UPI00339B1F28